MRSYWHRVGYWEMGNLDTGMHTGGTPHEERGRDWGGAPTNKAMPKITRS